MLIAFLLISAYGCVRYVLVVTVLLGVRHVIGNAAVLVVADGIDFIVR